MDEQRHRACWRRRRIIYNNDGDDASKRAPEWSTSMTFPKP